MWMARVFALWGYLWEGGLNLVPSGSGIHYPLTSMGLLLDLTDVNAACSQRLQGGNLFKLQVLGEVLPLLELLWDFPKPN